MRSAGSGADELFAGYGHYTLSPKLQAGRLLYLAMGADLQTSAFSYKATFVPPPNYRLHRDVATASLAAGLIRCNSSGNDGRFCAVPGSPVRLPLNIAAPACVPSRALRNSASRSMRASGSRGALLAIAQRPLTAQAPAPQAENRARRVRQPCLAPNSMAATAATAARPS